MVIGPSLYAHGHVCVLSGRPHVVDSGDFLPHKREDGDCSSCLCLRLCLCISQYLFHLSQGDGLGLVAGVAPALPGVSPGPGHLAGRLRQAVEECHLFGQAEGAEVGLLRALLGWDKRTLGLLHLSSLLGFPSLAGLLPSG